MKNRAVFFDRDGVINNNAEHYYVYKKDQLKLNPDIDRAIAAINKAGLMVIVVSNQGGISRGHYDTNHVDTLHNEIQRRLELAHAQVDDFYFCPHHNKIEKCLCRKPGTLLIEKAAAAYDIDLSISFMIGDSDRDIEAGEKAGLQCYKVEANTSVWPVITKILDLI